MSESRMMIAKQPVGDITIVKSLDEAVKIASIVAQSKLFKCENASEAFVKIMAGVEMGFGPITAMTSIHIIEGKPSPGADLVAAAIRRKGSGYDYEVNEISDVACKATFFRVHPDGTRKEIGSLRYTLEEAKQKRWDLFQNGKEKLTWIQRPANMLYARVMTDGKRFYCPDVLTSVFDQDEIDSPAFAQNVSVHVVNNGDQRATNRSPIADDPERPTALTINPDGSLHDDFDDITQLRCHIEELVREVGVTPEQMKRKLDRDCMGVESIQDIIDFSMLRRLENELLAAKSKRQQQKPKDSSAPVATRKE